MGLDLFRINKIKIDHRLGFTASTSCSLSSYTLWLVMAKEKGKGKTPGASTAHKPCRSTVIPPKTVAEDSESDHAIHQPLPPLRLGTFDNEDDIYIDEEQEIVYMREEEEEGSCRQGSKALQQKSDDHERTHPS